MGLQMLLIVAPEPEAESAGDRPHDQLATRASTASVGL
jgi:hypothetical protein